MLDDDTRDEFAKLDKTTKLEALLRLTTLEATELDGKLLVVELLDVVLPDLSSVLPPQAVKLTMNPICISQ